MTRDRDLDAGVRRALGALDSGEPRPDLADRAYRRAMAEGRAPTFAERFVLAGRSMVLAGAAVAAAVWLGVILRGGDASIAAADPADATELLSVWAGEEDAP